MTEHDGQSIEGTEDSALAAVAEARSTIQKYLTDIVFGANDGVITTLAVISGVVGARLAPDVILILGLANLVADGFSMAASNFLALRSEKRSDRPESSAAARHGLATLIGFVLAGAIPLLAYLLPLATAYRFPAAGGLGLLALFAVGAGRAAFREMRWWRAGLEMLVIGAVAAGVAYGIGFLGRQLTDAAAH